MDPLAEQTFDSYGYVYNNPINLIDPTGMSAEDPHEYVFNHDGSFKERIDKPREHYIKIDKTNTKIQFADPVNDP